MDAPPAGADLQEAARALDRAEWREARSAFEAVLENRESAEALEGLGLARWFLGDVREGIALRERAFDAYLREERCSDAARMAVWVSHQHKQGGRASAARGWLARAERSLENVDVCAGHGWVAVERARQSASAQERITHAARALDVGRTMAQSDLEVLAVSLPGRATVDAGRWE
jgi:tetratricopeptide (TPR) repeat protein